MEDALLDPSSVELVTAIVLAERRDDVRPHPNTSVDATGRAGEQCFDGMPKERELFLGCVAQVYQAAKCILCLALVMTFLGCMMYTLRTRSTSTLRIECGGLTR